LSPHHTHHPVSFLPFPRHSITIPPLLYPLSLPHRPSSLGLGIGTRQPVAHAGAGLVGGLGGLLGAVLQALHGLFGSLFARHAVGPDGLLAVGGQLRLPVALALLLLGEGVLLVLLEGLGVGVGLELSVF
jgi:hypothetical protein